VRGRILTSHIPLFTSYVFLLANQQERLTALGTHRVVMSLKVSDQDRPLERPPADPPPDRKPGLPSRRKTGCNRHEGRDPFGTLAGLKGTVLRTAAGRRFVVQVDFIQRGALRWNWTIICWSKAS